jgi:hypothetical protein
VEIRERLSDYPVLDEGDWSELESEEEEERITIDAEGYETARKYDTPMRDQQWTRWEPSFEEVPWEKRPRCTFVADSERGECSASCTGYYRTPVNAGEPDEEWIYYCVDHFIIEEDD